jgi:hypothetical protein
MHSPETSTKDQPAADEVHGTVAMVSLPAFVFGTCQIDGLRTSAQATPTVRSEHEVGVSLAKVQHHSSLPPCTENEQLLYSPLSPQIDDPFAEGSAE